MFDVFTKRVQKLKQYTNLRLHDENYASFVVSLLVHKMGGGEGALIQEEMLILNFDRKEGRLFKGGC